MASSAKAATAAALMGAAMRSFKLAGRDLTLITPDSESDVPEQFRIRQGKRERLLAEGRDPYPVEVARTHTLAEIRQAYPDLPANTETGEIVGVAGRVMFARNSGKLCFATLQEGDGTQLQVMISLDRVGQESLDAWKSDADLGDIVFVHGDVISSRRGELSVLADSWQIVSKALRPLPVAHKEMGEESRVRQRYVDLIVRPEARTIARQRVAVVRAVRSALERRGFLEVETPMLQTLGRRCCGAPVRHTLQCARCGPLPPDRAGTVPEALLGGRFRQGLRVESGVPKRRRGFHTFAGICDARDLSGLRHLRRFRRHDARGYSGGRRRSDRHPKAAIAGWRCLRRGRRMEDDTNVSVSVSGAR